MMLDRNAHNRLAALADNRFGIGGNSPPGPIDFANESIAALSAWMKDPCLSGYHPHPLHLGCFHSPE
jgi:hypothetical protein